MVDDITVKRKGLQDRKLECKAGSQRRIIVILSEVMSPKTKWPLFKPHLFILPSFVRQGPTVAQDGLKLAIQSRLPLNFSYFSLYLMSAETQACVA